MPGKLINNASILSRLTLLHVSTLNKLSRFQQAADVKEEGKIVYAKEKLTMERETIAQKREKFYKYTLLGFWMFVIFVNTLLLKRFGLIGNNSVYLELYCLVLVF